ncbi:MAG: hypothetical protein JWQ35_2237 [Bacteriovoracaceae bacterium]|nr:hypothetical protein [Bacteriovoracaceae bacterium]
MDSAATPFTEENAVPPHSLKSIIRSPSHREDKIKSKTSSPSAVPITGFTTRKNPIEASWHSNSKREIGADIRQGVGPDFPPHMELPGSTPRQFKFFKFLRKLRSSMQTKRQGLRQCLYQPRANCSKVPLAF